jgi:hypothetical protein
MTRRTRRPSVAAVWKVLAIPLVSVLSATLGLGAAPPIPEVPGPRIGIGPILLGFTRVQVEAELGKPKRVVSTGGALDPEIRYKGFTIWLEHGDKVARMRSTNSKYCLPGNVCPGASAVSVRSSIGSLREGATPGTGLITFPASVAFGERCLAEVTIQKELVAAVEIRCYLHESSL